MRVVVAGRPVVLTADALLASGGEGTAWAVGDHVLKVWHDPVRAPSAERLGELAAVQDPDVVICLNQLYGHSWLLM